MKYQLEDKEVTCHMGNDRLKTKFGKVLICMFSWILSYSIAYDHLSVIKTQIKTR